MSAAGPPQGANPPPRGAAQRRKPRAWGDHTSAAGEAKPSQGPKVAAPRDSEEADAPTFAPRRWRKEADR